MHKARAFFFVCAGIFLLALAYHLGAVNARAQGSGQVRVVGTGPGQWALVVSGGAVYRLDSQNRVWVRTLDVPPVPVSDLLSLQWQGCAISANGEGWVWDTGGWGSIGIVPGATPAQQQTLGQVKARYLK